MPAMLVKKRCKSCDRHFLDDGESPFVTCHHCRKPLPDKAGSCTRWAQVSREGHQTEMYHGQELRDRA